MEKRIKDIHSLVKEFLSWGSGFKLEAERDYKQKSKPLIFHLKCYGLYANHIDYAGKDLKKIMSEAICDFMTNKAKMDFEIALSKMYWEKFNKKKARKKNDKDKP